MMLDLVELAIFVRTVDGRSLTAAATAMSLPRSTVTRRLAQLEDRLGVQLLQRTTRSMSLTAAGEAFYPRAARLVSDAESAAADMRQSQTEPRGRLRVTAPVEFGDGFLFDVAVQFLRDWPEVTLELDLSSRYVDLVSEGFDLAIRAGRLQDSTLLARKLSPVVMRLYSTRAYLDAHGALDHPSQLTLHETVCLGKGQGPLEWTLVHRREQVVVPLQPRLLVTHFQALRSAIAGGLGIGLMPTFYGDRAVNEGRVVPVLQEWSAEGASVHAVMPANRHPRPAVQRFVETVHRAMQMTGGLT
jgi:DNA-binding transcriptional LysR family regulator